MRNLIKRFAFGVQRQYRSSRPIIPIGCDCHPAQVLRMLGIRTISFPFDWLCSHPARGISYVNSNVENRFDLFLCDLKPNRHGHLTSQHYPETEFVHFSRLTTDAILRQKFSERAERFMDMYENHDCSFIYNLSAIGLGNDLEVESFIDSVGTFLNQSSRRHTLHVYIRYDEDTSEGQERGDLVEAQLRETKDVVVVKYVRQLKAYGIWGSPAKHIELIESLGIAVRQTWPRFFWK